MKVALSMFMMLQLVFG
jgi:hypothetical protein